MKQLHEYADGTLKKMLRAAQTEEERANAEDRKIQGGSTSWPQNGDGSPIAREPRNYRFSPDEIRDELYINRGVMC